MASIKMAACKALVDFLQSQLPDVPVSAPQAPYSQDVAYPSIVVVPSQFTFVPYQEEEVDDSQPDNLLVRMGDFEGSVELRIAGTSAFAREELEERVMGLLLNENNPGVLVVETAPVRLGGVQYLARAVAGFELTKEAWREEMVFSDERYSFLELDASYPALVSRGSIDNPIRLIETLVLAVNHDLASDTADEERNVAIDGSISVYP